ncbi:hypothetical protein LPTSP4_21990 [Leptospira ryugenii]|uniref:Polyketide cyclase/dehydrase and lipid transport n=1 Tax=Leptospira ryugenii TaxID=1917863 RepID=A0A2P2E1C2_9LEPT|nr:polyketide cyclase/dehydrase and lipid transport [Leptospira ryugenii]GBF50672.1 hypothetical protein LPTSP4_21990 [Leptospira ryugenii]
MILTEKEIFIQQSPEKVFSYLYDLNTMPNYNASVKSVKALDSSGATLPQYEIEINFGFFSLKEKYSITEVKANEYFTAQLKHTGLQFEDRYEIIAKDSGTLLKVKDIMELKGLLVFSEPLVKGNLSSQMWENMLRLKSNLEST